MLRTLIARPEQRFYIKTWVKDTSFYWEGNEKDQMKTAMEKRSPVFRIYVGHETIRLCGDYFINHEIKIPVLIKHYFTKSIM